MGRGDNPNSRANLTAKSSEVARKNGAKGGRKSGESKRARKTLREELIALLESGNTQEKISLALLSQALEGNTKAFEVVRDTIGEKPIDKVETTTTVDIELCDWDEDKTT